MRFLPGKDLSRHETPVSYTHLMAYSLYLAGFDVKDVTMTDLISGRETLEDVNMIVYCGGFSNSDVLGSAKGWAGAFLFNPKAKEEMCIRDRPYRL